MRELYDMIFSLPPRSFTLIAVLLGFMLIDDLNANQQNSLANFIILIGQILETNSGQQQVLEGIQSNKNNQELNERIKKLEKELGIR